MKFRTQLVAALLVLCGIVATLVYAGKSGHGSDRFGCHAHGATTYHCH
jgi:hypothetical protein